MLEFGSLVDSFCPGVTGAEFELKKRCEIMRGNVTIFVNGCGERASGMVFVKIREIGTAPEKTDPEWCS